MRRNLLIIGICVLAAFGLSLLLGLLTLQYDCKVYSSNNTFVNPGVCYGALTAGGLGLVLTPVGLILTVLGLVLKPKGANIGLSAPLRVEARSVRDGETARTLVLVGILLEALEAVVFVLLGLLYVTSDVPLPTGPLPGAALLGLGLIGIPWLAAVYYLAYKPIEQEEYETARTPTLVFSILSLLTVGLVSGVLFLVAYVKLRDAVGGSTELVQGPLFAPGSGPAETVTTCSSCGHRVGSVATFCPDCGSLLT